MRPIGIVTACLVLGLPAGGAGAAPLEVVTTLPAYASIAQAVGGDHVSAQAIARGDQDAHFVKPKPSYALMLRHADLFVTTGLDLELWAPTLVDKSGNRTIADGQPGFVSASQGVPLLEVPASASRAGGDIHIYGNPHVFTSPLNAKIIAANVAAGLKRVDPDHAADYDANLRAFQQRIDRALYGQELATLLGGETLDPLARQGRLMEFLSGRDYQGRKLIDLLGGWMKQGLAFRGKKIVTYHKNWIYFTRLFGLQVVDYVEPKPGIPPSPQHVLHLIQTVRDQEIEVILAASYFDPRKPREIAQRTGARAVIVPLGPGVEGIDDYFELVDFWVNGLAAAYGS